MKVDDLITKPQEHAELRLLYDRCSQFFEESGGSPLLKNLPETYGNFHKVKVRKRKGVDVFNDTFNEAFDAEHPGLRQRAIFANGELSFVEEGEELEPFFIFPIDEYKFMYSLEVENSSRDYKQVFDSLFEEFGARKGNQVICDLLAFTYRQENLAEGIEQGSELILYNIPYYYAIRTSIVDDYGELLTQIQGIE